MAPKMMKPVDAEKMMVPRLTKKLIRNNYSPFSLIGL